MRQARLLDLILLTLDRAELPPIGLTIPSSPPPQAHLFSVLSYELKHQRCAKECMRL